MNKSVTWGGFIAALLGVAFLVWFFIDSIAQELGKRVNVTELLRSRSDEIAAVGVSSLGSAVSSWLGGR